jgi:hypothetical protein
MNAHSDMVLVDLVGSDMPYEELFGVVYEGQCRAKYDDPVVACDHASKLANSVGAKWDVTIQARNAADMS